MQKKIIIKYETSLKLYLKNIFTDFIAFLFNP